ncbi:MAG: 2,3-bisphosphoglycerate-independent phosphoglycerate mutase [Gammaproteobacteria bacterium]
MTTPCKPIVLIILDGWGYRTEREHNAIAQANTPAWDNWWQTYPHTLIAGSGNAVGLPDGQMGNSEVGHLTIGAGRTLPQDIVRINQAIENGEFASNSVFNDVINHTLATDKALHILGLLSPGGVHSHEQHIFALIKMAATKGLRKIYLHAFLDGRDMPPRSALPSLLQATHLFENLNCGKVASISGRYYAMDRNHNWERTQQVYDMLTTGVAHYHAIDAMQALQAGYDRQENDEFIAPTTVGDKPFPTIHDGDSVVFMNFRADRARALTRAFVSPDFAAFPRTKIPKLSFFTTLTQYAADIPSTIAFPPQSLANNLGDYLAQHQLTQLRLAETEKYAHVTFFFNGGIEPPCAGEARILIDSPKVATYDLQPAMSAEAVTDALVAAIHQQQYDVIICNYANADMVGHTGNFKATVQAIETLDQCLNKVAQAAHSVNAEIIITADHGNAEFMHDTETGQAHTAHTNRPVPFIYLGQRAEIATQDGGLADIAPTILFLLDLPAPAEMTGKSLLKWKT